MSKESFITGIVGLLLGVVIATYSVNSQNTSMMRMMGMRTAGNGPTLQNEGMMGMGSSMTDMMGSMTGKQDTAFDQAFLSAMIVHHEGAIDMAKEALKSTSRPEISQLARDIISAQTKEIDIMSTWQDQWGY